MINPNQSAYRIVSGSDYAVRVETKTTGIIGICPIPKSMWIIAQGKLITTTVVADVRFKQEQQ